MPLSFSTCRQQHLYYCVTATASVYPPSSNTAPSSLHPHCLLVASSPSGPGQTLSKRKETNSNLTYRCCAQTSRKRLWTLIPRSRAKFRPKVRYPQWMRGSGRTVCQHERKKRKLRAFWWVLHASLSWTINYLFLLLIDAFLNIRNPSWYFHNNK